MKSAREILRYWLDSVGEAAWYRSTDQLDQDIRNRFEETWNAARDGACGFWLTHPMGSLAYIILTDQFPRNMFRGTAQAFETDRLARAAAKMAIAQSWDLRIEEPERQFIYMPLMHSESLTDQERAVRMFLARMPESSSTHLVHARAHREEIRRFGRFPGRNDALARVSSASERAHQAAGGYGHIVQSLTG